MNKLKAFPKSNANLPSFQEGMDLRDWFAGQALTKLIGTAPINVTVESAYRWADAMMKQREVNNV
jgi:hypothetical protein